jgi:hypothetical protein
VKVRLDRVLADDNLRDIFSAANVEHLVTPCLDHLALLLRLTREVRIQPAKKCAHYEIFWERDPALKEVIEAAWKDVGNVHDLGSISNGLRQTMDKLQSWGRRKFGNVTRELSRMRERIKSLLESGADSSDVREATDAMNELLNKEEMLRLQRSRID